MLRSDLRTLIIDDFVCQQLLSQLRILDSAIAYLALETISDSNNLSVIGAGQASGGSRAFFMFLNLRETYPENTVLCDDFDYFPSF